MKLLPRNAWAIVAAVFAILTACSGLTVYSLSVLLHAFVAEGRFTIEEASFASSFFAIAGGLAGLPVGQLVERHDVRKVMTGGTLLMVSAFAALPWVTSLPALYAFYVMLGLGFGAAAIIPCTTVITRWFTANRAAALSIASTGNSFGAIVITPPVAFLIAQAGLDGASAWLALLIAVGVLPLTWLVMRSWPPAAGAGSQDAPSEVREQRRHRAATVYRAAIRTRFFWMANLAFLLGMAAHVGGQTHLFNLLMVRQADTTLAGGAIALMATASVAARFVAVWVLARISNQTFIIVLLGVQGAALCGIGLATSDLVLLLCVIAYGSTLGNFITAQSLLLADAFGAEAYARVYGLSRVVCAPGVLLGPGLMGVLFTVSQSYSSAYLAVGALSLMGIAALVAAGPTPR